jgi:hypothetical protein
MARRASETLRTTLTSLLLYIRSELLLALAGPAVKTATVTGTIAHATMLVADGRRERGAGSAGFAAVL